MLVLLWSATKLEGHRRQVVGCSRLASVLRLLPWAVTSIELHLMSLMGWEPYAGWHSRRTTDAAVNPSCTINELHCC